MSIRADHERLLEICERALKWARDRDYTGFNKHDALNSPLLRAASLNNKWLRILFIQTVMRAPVNFRPLLRVEKTKNPKGLALFTRAYLNLFRITDDTRYRDEAIRLLDWLLEHPSAGFRGLSWGYPYPWQDLGFYAPTGFPNRIVTYFVGRALVEAFQTLGDRRYLEAAEKAVEFVLEEPKILFEDETMKCLSYVPVQEIEMAVMDVSALCGALCAIVGRHTGREALIAEARKLVAWVVDKQTDYGAWYYTEPPGNSHITHDNYHSGEILDAIADYSDQSGDVSFRPAYDRGLSFYRKNLLTGEGRPKWMYNQTFPQDAHGYAQCIITFSRSGEHDLADAVAGRAVQDLWNGLENRFRYQRRRLYTKGFTLMRWSQAWLTFALSYHLLVRQTES